MKKNKEKIKNQPSRSDLYDRNKHLEKKRRELVTNESNEKNENEKNKEKIKNQLSRFDPYD